MANTPADSLGERIVERLDDFAEGVFSFMGGEKGCEKEGQGEVQVVDEEAEEVEIGAENAETDEKEAVNSESDSQTGELATNNLLYCYWKLKVSNATSTLLCYQSAIWPRSRSQ